MRPEQGKVVVVGSLNMDIVVRSSRFPASGETMFGQEVHFIPGGKGGNQAVACARLGHKAVMLGAVGDDGFGQSLLESLKANGVRTGHMKKTNAAATGIASITLTPADNTILVVPGANETLTAEDINAWSSVISEASILLVQLEIPMEAVAAAVDIADRHGIPVILNPAPARKIAADILRKVRYITPNQSELLELTGIALSDEGLERAIDALLERGPEFVVATLGSKGAAWKQRGGHLQRIDAHRLEVTDTTGAGDAFNAGLACTLSRGELIGNGVRFAVAVSALAVTKFGAQDGMPMKEEVERFMRSFNEGATR
ncbi:ribokinase [Paenibacillus thiaminolyticus]|uniref:Ribokinase n=1 Tax=Paenibacillus thiaminolyticus TaxID=49283 RepID=A0A3A3GP34_PANTH|nr:ribokinase [Paenibacillus thiaminolyticus]RJG25921.1 ribokinase [Paenibacillus thiaminolyticus]